MPILSANRIGGMTDIMEQDNGKDEVMIVTVNVGDILYSGMLEEKVV